MANVIKRGESILIPFEDGESVRDSQSKPRIYRSKEQYERFGYLSRGAELVEYVEVVRCEKCKHSKQTAWYSAKLQCCHKSHMSSQVPYEVPKDHFCSYGERREGE